ncbi:MAG: YdaS family helix-turn-helix protein [Pseudomonadota bacterium]
MATAAEGFDRAIESVKTQAELAKRLGLTRAAITRWERSIPVSRVVAVSEVTELPVWVLRPDVFPQPEGATPSDRTLSEANRKIGGKEA